MSERSHKPAARAMPSGKGSNSKAGKNLKRYEIPATSPVDPEYQPEGRPSTQKAKPKKASAVAQA